MSTDLIIGREAGSSAPRLCVKQGERSFFIGTPGSVPKSVSRSHCRVQIDGDKMVLSNVSDSNAVLVNGLEYKTKNINMTDLIELGPERYRLDLSCVLALFEKDSKQQKDEEKAKTYHIAHLKTIWENYSEGKMDIQIGQGKMNAVSAIPGVLSMISIALSFVFTDAIRIVFITIAAILAFSFAIVRINNAGKIPLKQKEMDERFQDDYVCPHCKHFLGNQNYKLVLKNGGCPWCKSKFIE